MGLERQQRVQLVADRRQPPLGDATGIHERRVHRADLLQRGTRIGVGLGRLGDDRGHAVLGFQRQFGERPVAREPRRNVGALQPAFVDELEEIFAGRDGLADFGDIDAPLADAGPVGRLHGLRGLRRGLGCCGVRDVFARLFGGAAGGERHAQPHECQQVE